VTTECLAVNRITTLLRGAAGLEPTTNRLWSTTMEAAAVQSEAYSLLQTSVCEVSSSQPLEVPSTFTCTSLIETSSESHVDHLSERRFSNQ